MTNDSARAPFLAGKRRIIVYAAIALLIILVLRENAQVKASGARIDVVDLSVDGLYWLPLHKTGRCRFSATMQRDDKATGKYRGNISGTIDLTVNGLCSAYQYRRMMGEKVAEKIRDCVVKDLRRS